MLHEIHIRARDVQNLLGVGALRLGRFEAERRLRHRLGDRHHRPFLLLPVGQQVSRHGRGLGRGMAEAEQDAQHNRNDPGKDFHRTPPFRNHHIGSYVRQVTPLGSTYRRT